VCIEVLIPIGFVGTIRVRDDVPQTGTGSGTAATVVLNFLTIIRSLLAAQLETPSTSPASVERHALDHSFEIGGTGAARGEFMAQLDWLLP
jgi:hypothetical protein